MMVDSSKSTFGEQILSTRLSSPRVKLGSSTRSTNGAEPWMIEKNLGTSSDYTTSIKSSFGCQGTNFSSASVSIGTKSAFDYKMSGPNGQIDPGPGSYDYHLVDKAIGKQILSHHKGQSMPEIKISSGSRFGQHTAPNSPTIFKSAFQTPGPDSAPRLTSGNLGDAPHPSLGKGSRSTVYGPDITPSYVSNPAPNQYEGSKALGPQVESGKASAAKIKIGTGKREDSMKQFTSREAERELYGRGSPGPGGLLPSDSFSSRARSTSGGGWGKSTGDRFSEVKSPTSLSSSRAASPAKIGPGSYRV